MSHNAYIRGGGNWLGGIPVQHGELTQMDQTLFKCLNADDGGTWAPSSAIIIGGLGLSLTTKLNASSAEFAGTVTIDHAASIGTTSGDVLEVFSSSVFIGGAGFIGGLGGTDCALSGILTVGGATTLNGPTLVQALTAAGASSFQNVSCTTFQASGAAILTSTLAVSGAATVSGTLTAAGNLNVADGSTFTAGPQVFSGNARPVRAPVLGALSGGGTFSPQQASTYFFASGMSSQTYTLGTVGVVDGDTLDIVLQTGVSGTLTVTGALGGSLTMRHFSTSDVWAVRFVYIASLTAWAPVFVSAYP